MAEENLVSLEDAFDERPLKSDKELKLEKEELEIKIAQITAEHERLLNLLEENRLNRKRLNAYKRKNYIYAFLALVISSFLLLAFVLWANVYNYAILIFPLIFMFISFSYNRKTRTILLLLSTIGFLTYIYFFYDDYMINFTKVNAILDKIKREEIPIKEKDYVIFSSSLFTSILVTSFRFIMSVGNIEIAKKVKSIKYIFKKVIGLFLSLLVIYIITVVSNYLILNLIKDQTLITKIDNYKIMVMISAASMLMLSHLFNNNTFKFSKRRAMKGRA